MRLFIAVLVFSLWDGFASADNLLTLGVSAPSAGGGSNLTVLDGSAHNNSNTAVTTLSASLTTTQGSGVAVACITYNSSPVISATVTSPNLTWTQQLSDGPTPPPNDKINIYTAPYSSNLSGESITVTFAATDASFVSMDVFGVGKALTASFLDGAGAQGNPDPISITGSNAFDFVVGCYRVGTASPTNGSGWTQISGANFQLSEYKTTTVAPSGLSVTVGTGVGTANGGVALAIKSQ